jgi:hypothetical protein
MRPFRISPGRYTVLLVLLCGRVDVIDRKKPTFWIKPRRLAEWAVIAIGIFLVVYFVTPKVTHVRKWDDSINPSGIEAACRREFGALGKTQVDDCQFKLASEQLESRHKAALDRAREAAK